MSWKTHITHWLMGVVGERYRPLVNTENIERVYRQYVSDLVEGTVSPLRFTIAPSQRGYGVPDLSTARYLVAASNRLSMPLPFVNAWAHGFYYLYRQGIVPEAVYSPASYTRKQEIRKTIPSQRSVWDKMAASIKPGLTGATIGVVVGVAGIGAILWFASK